MSAKRSKLNRILVGAALTILTLLGGCAGFSLTGAPSTYDLTAPSNLKPTRTARAQLTINEPTALQAFDSNRIVVRPGNGEVAYLSGAQWSDRLPKLVQDRLLQSFENAHRIASVGRSSDKLAPDIALISDIRAFEIDAKASEAVVEISAKLISERTGRIIAANVFRATRPASAINGASASAALDDALSEVMRAIVVWSAARV